MGKVDDILFDLVQDISVQGTDGHKAFFDTKAELLELLKQAPKKKTIDNEHEYDQNTFNKGYNQAIDDYLANITKLFKEGRDD